MAATSAVEKSCQKVTKMLRALLFAFVLSFHGYRKKSLTASGSISAFFVGWCMMSCGFVFGIILIAFYYSSSKWSKWRKSVKLKMEQGEENGRNWKQVLGCSGCSVVVALAYVYGNWENWPDSLPIDFKKYYAQSYLMCCFLGHYACCNGDTWASEIGVFSKEDPILITKWWTNTRVPRGTNGGISKLGTLASMAGGGFIGMVYCLYSVSAFGVDWMEWRVIVLGAWAGTFGSILDSILGATIQITLYDVERKQIVHAKGDKVKVYGGYDVLTNEQVNLVSTVVITLASGVVGEWLLM